MEIDATYQIILEGDSLILKIPATQAQYLDPVISDEFYAERLQLKFKRVNNVATGFELDAGRVQNLKFNKK